MLIYVNHRNELTQPSHHSKALKTFIDYVSLILKHKFPSSTRIQAASAFITSDLKPRIIEKATLDSYVKVTFTPETGRKAFYDCRRCGSRSRREDEALLHLKACLQLEVECRDCKGWYTITTRGVAQNHKCRARGH